MPANSARYRLLRFIVPLLLLVASPALANAQSDIEPDVVNSLAETVDTSPVPTANDGADVVKDEAAIRQRLADWSTDFTRKDADAACDLFSKDVVAEFQGGPTADHSAVCDKIRALMAHDDVDLTYTPQIDEVMPIGDYALVRVTWTLAVTRAESTTTSSERGFDLFRQEVDGKWRIARYLSYPIQ